MREGTITLPDGRALGYREEGNPDGIPFFYFHGNPGSRAFTLDVETLNAAGARQITLERPGFGLSDPKPGRTLLDWPADVAAAAEEFGLDRFAVLGCSMGAPNAMACGYALADRVAIVALQCGIGPVFDQPQFDPLLSNDMQAILPIAREDREQAIEIVRAFTAPSAESYAADPDAFFDTWLAGWPELDQRNFLARRPIWEAILAGTYSRPDTFADEVISSVGPWGFAPADVRVPVRLWHGDKDEAAPLEVAQAVAEQVPDADLTVYPGEAHALNVSHHKDWVATLTEWAS